MDVEQFWTAYNELQMRTDLEVEVLVNQRAMAETVIRSGITSDARYLTALERVVANPYPNIWHGTEKVDSALIQTYFNIEYAETYWHVCEVARSGTGSVALEASIIASALAGYTERQDYDDNWTDFVTALAEHGLDLQIFLDNLKSNLGKLMQV